MKRLFLGLAIQFGVGCAVTAPDGNGHIVTHCIVTDGGATAVGMCATGQVALCLAGTDAGNGQVLARCCDSTLSDQECARRGGFALADGGTNQ